MCKVYLTIPGKILINRLCPFHSMVGLWLPVFVAVTVKKMIRGSLFQIHSLSANLGAVSFNTVTRSLSTNHLHTPPRVIFRRSSSSIKEDGVAINLNKMICQGALHLLRFSSFSCGVVDCLLEVEALSWLPCCWLLTLEIILIDILASLHFTASCCCC